MRKTLPHFLPAFLLLGCVWLGGTLGAQQRTTLSPETDDWQALDRYQQQMSKTDFSGRLNTIFAPGGASAKTIGSTGNGADIVTENGNRRKGRYRLLFAPQGDGQLASASDGSGAPAGHAQTAPEGSGQAVPRSSGQALSQSGAATLAAAGAVRPAPATEGPRAPYWKPAAEIRAQATAEKPLQGLRVALDPGHIGGQWAFMEKREWSFGGGPIFREGDFVLRVAQILADELTALGAEVVLVRDDAEPVTRLRPEDFTDVARQRLLTRSGGVEPSEAALRNESELLFYRVAEIRARAERINGEIQPDIVICLHADGTSFPPAGTPRLPEGGTLHVLVNGAYSADELAYDDQRLDMLGKLLSGAGEEEIALGDAVARQLAIDTGLPPMTYTGANAVQVNDNPFLWARNLIANRIYQCPTIFIEAYTANREPFYTRFAMGEYEDTLPVRGMDRKNLWREYADSVRDALVRHYGPQGAGSTQGNAGGGQ